MMDTQPIAVDRLTASAWVTLRNLLDILNEIREDNRTHRPQPRSTPWAVLEHGRSSRMIMLDGPRGTGKTSLLLTLIDQWNRRRDPRSPVDKPARELLREHDVGVCALTPLDFDPHPQHLHPYAWLVLAFEPLVEWLAARSGRAGLDEAAGERSLRDIWRDLYTHALLGWDEDVQRQQMSADIDGFVASSLESHRGWHHLRPAWKDFMDRLLVQLEHRGELGAEDLVVLPIDDLDLHPTMAGDLLRALRLMHHRRLVFIMTGDSQHLTKVHTRELLPPRSSLENATKEQRQQNLRYYTSLAIDMVNKAIPRAYRFQVPLLTLAQALSFRLHGRDIEASMQYEEAVEQLLPQITQPNERALLARWIATATQQAYRYRDVVQMPSADLRADLMELCLLTPHLHGRPLFQRVDAAGSAQFIVTTRVHLRAEPSYARRPTLANAVNTAEDRILVATELNAMIAADEPVKVPNVVGIMAFLNPGTIDGLEWSISPWSLLQVTDWSTSEPALPARLGWPSAEVFRTIGELESARHSLVELLSSAEPEHSQPEARFAAWVAINLQGIGLDLEVLALTLGTRAVWSALSRLSRMSSGKRGERLQLILDWCETRLPILAAPEFGLPEPLAAELLRWISRESWFGDRMDTLAEGWLIARREALAAAFEREEARFSVAVRVQEATQWLGERYATHVWYTFRRGPIELPVGARKVTKKGPKPATMAIHRKTP